MRCCTRSARPTRPASGSLCFVSYGMIAPRSVFGEVARDLADDLSRADLALVWGANPATASPPENLVRLKRCRPVAAASS